MQDDKPAPEPSFEELERESKDLKKRIEEERKKIAMPLNSSLGDPVVDAANADGHNDLKEDDDD
jgi:uncharacterized FlaG/YvyC family protein